MLKFFVKGYGLLLEFKIQNKRALIINKTKQNKKSTWPILCTTHKFNSKSSHCLNMKNYWTPGADKGDNPYDLRLYTDFLGHKKDTE